ncbi:uncharacterized protein [Clytia hemisphaerica]|uniref:Uncharacterized protein n=1 Tax=Clytia hemisphaerica TaxID=252671 RepID=A0A7M6DMU3_9CNID
MAFRILYAIAVVTLSFELTKATKPKKPTQKLGPENVPSNFLVSFTAVKKLDRVIEVLVQQQSGTIAQDSTPGDEKLAIRTETRDDSDNSLISREVTIVKRVNGQYTKYNYFEDASGFKSCGKTESNKFEGFFYDLLTGGVQASNSPDVYLYDDGPLDVAKGFGVRKTFNFGFRHATQPFVPIQIRTLKLYAFRRSDDKTMTLGYYYIMIPNEAYFRVPAECL